MLCIGIKSLINSPIHKWKGGRAWLNALVLKTSSLKGLVSSNLTLSAIICIYKSTEVSIKQRLVWRTKLPATWMKYESLKRCGQEGLEKDMVVGSGEAIADQLKQYNYWCKWIAHCRYTRR